MRIGIFDPYLDDIGGGEKYMMSIAEYLSREHQVDIFWDRESDIEKIEEQFSLDLSRCNVKKNIFSKKFGSLKRIFGSWKYDAIIFLSDGSIPFVLSKKLFIHIQQPLSNMDINSYKFKYKLSRVNKFIFNSKYSKSFVDPTIVQRAEVLYPPVSINSKKVKKQSLILHVGRFRARNVEITDYKKQDFMIDVFKKMVDNGLKEWKFAVAVGVHDQELKKFRSLQERGKNYPIEFWVNQNNNKLWDIYSRAKLYWHASGYGEDLKEHPEYAEHFGISTVEAMGGGVVPVVINAGGQKEIVQDGKNGFLWNTQEELIEKTNFLIQNKEIWDKMSKEAIKRAGMFSKERFCEGLKTFFIDEN